MFSKMEPVSDVVGGALVVLTVEVKAPLALFYCGQPTNSAHQQHVVSTQFIVRCVFK